MAQWIFKISGSDADSLTRSFTPKTGLTFRILKDAAGKWSLVTGEWLDPHDDSSLGQLAMRGGAVALESHVKGCVIKPWDSSLFDNAPSQAPWEVLLPKSRTRCRKAAFLRPGDVVEWKDHYAKLSISFTHGNDVEPKVEVKEELPKVEVSSSAVKQEPNLFGMDGAVDDPSGNETESGHGGDDLDIGPRQPAIKSQELSFTGRGDDATSQPRTPSASDGEPYSTARTAATVIQETPSVKRQRPLSQEDMDDMDITNISSIQPVTAQSSGPAVVTDSMKTALDQELSIDEDSVSAVPVDKAHLHRAAVKASVDEALVNRVPADDTPLGGDPAEVAHDDETSVDEEQDDDALQKETVDEGPDDGGLDEEVPVGEAVHEAAPDEEADAPESTHEPDIGDQAIDMEIEDAVCEAVDTTVAMSEQVPSSIKAEDPIKEEASKVEVPDTTTPAGIKTDNQDESDLPELGSILSQSSAKSRTKRKAAELLEDFEEPTTAHRSTRGKKLKVEQASQESEEPSSTQSSDHGPLGGTLDGLKILVTGKLDDLTRQEVTQLIEDNGGIPGKKLDETLDYVVFGSRPGPKKLEPIERLGLTIINQEELMQLISGHKDMVPASNRKLRASQASANDTSSKKGTPSSTDTKSPRISASQASLKGATHLNEYAGPKPQILFSNTDVYSRAGVKQFLASQKASQTDKLDKKGSNFLCVGPGQLKTTAKLLMSLVLRKEIVTQSWVTASHKAGYLLQTTDYLPTSLATTDFDVDRTTLLQGQNVYFTPALRKLYGEGFKDMETIVKAAGADNVVSKPAKDIIKPGYEAIAIGLEDGDHDVLTLQGKGLTVYKKDFISNSILAGELQTDDLDLVIPSKAETKKVAKAAVKGKRISKG